MKLTIEQKQKLKELSSSVPLFPHPVNIAKTNKETGEVLDSILVDHFAITDHDPLFADTKHGVIGTLNLLNPSSPISSVKLPSQCNGFYRLQKEEDRVLQVRALAVYIIDMFKAGLGLLMLQEIPSQWEGYRLDFFKSLKILARKNNLHLDINSLVKSYQAPQKNGLSSNFGCGILVNLKSFVLTQDLSHVNSFFENRGFIYQAKSLLSGETLNFYNIHGDYIHSEELANFILEKTMDKNNILAGDTNIPITNQNALSILKKIPGASILTTATNNKVKDECQTLDGIYMDAGHEPEFLREKIYLVGSALSKQDTIPSSIFNNNNNFKKLQYHNISSSHRFENFLN